LRCSVSVSRLDWAIQLAGVAVEGSKTTVLPSGRTARSGPPGTSERRACTEKRQPPVQAPIGARPAAGVPSDQMLR